MGRGGGKVVSFLAIYYDDLSSNLGGYYFSVQYNIKTRRNEKEAGFGPLILSLNLDLKLFVSNYNH